MNQNDRISIVLEASAWDAILRVLSEAPYRVSAPLIQSIQSQCLMSAEERKDAEDVARPGAA